MKGVEEEEDTTWIEENEIVTFLFHVILKKKEEIFLSLFCHTKNARKWLA